MNACRFSIFFPGGLLWLIAGRYHQQVEAFFVPPMAVLQSRVISGGHKALLHGKLFTVNALPGENNDPYNEVLSVLRETINEKEVRIQDKEALFQLLFREKEARLEDMKDALITAKVQTSIFWAKFDTETNLRPLLEMRTRDWYDKYKNSLGENANKLFMAKRFEKFVDTGLQGNGPTDLAFHRHELQDCFDGAIKLGKLETKSQKRNVRKEMQNIYETLLDNARDTNTPSGGIVGFVVNRNVYFAAAILAILMYFGDSHSVFIRGCQELRYKWPVQEEEKKKDDDDV